MLTHMHKGVFTTPPHHHTTLGEAVNAYTQICPLPRHGERCDRIHSLESSLLHHGEKPRTLTHTPNCSLPYHEGGREHIPTFVLYPRHGRRRKIVYSLPHHRLARGAGAMVIQLKQETNEYASPPPPWKPRMRTHTYALSPYHGGFHKHLHRSHIRALPPSPRNP